VATEHTKDGTNYNGWNPTRSRCHTADKVKIPAPATLFTKLKPDERVEALASSASSSPPRTLIRDSRSSSRNSDASSSSVFVRELSSMEGFGSITFFWINEERGCHLFPDTATTVLSISNTECHCRAVMVKNVGKDRRIIRCLCLKFENIF
jgi:hypothetical protein